jgi:hypothetical protein
MLISRVQFGIGTPDFPSGLHLLVFETTLRLCDILRYGAWPVRFLECKANSMYTRNKWTLIDSTC